MDMTGANAPLADATEALGKLVRDVVSSGLDASELARLRRIRTVVDGR
jgi:hypothetical protein